MFTRLVDDTRSGRLDPTLFILRQSKVSLDLILLRTGASVSFIHRPNFIFGLKV